MMLYYLVVLRKTEPKCHVLFSEADVSSFRFFNRKSAKEFMLFSIQALVDRLPPGDRVSVKEQDYVCHVWVREDSLAAGLVSDLEYPHQAAHAVLCKTLKEFCNATNVPGGATSEVVEVGSTPAEVTTSPAGVSAAGASFPALKVILTEYQDPRGIDPLLRVQAELDETKIILHHNLQSILERGENLDALVAKSDQLSTQAKVFYRTARKSNSCCK